MMQKPLMCVKHVSGFLFTNTGDLTQLVLFLEGFAVCALVNRRV